jgi:choline dehydrogenase-like flavoprotein
MPEEEIAEEGVLTPLEPVVQDPLLREILAENQLPNDTPLEKPQPTPAAQDEVDCVVIGLGAGGAPLLARLAQAGLKVVALEAGPWHNPEKDFATDERAQDFLFWNDERLAAGADPLAMGKNNSGTGVGGSTLHYTAYTPRPLPDDLHLKRDFGQGVDWPLEYSDLAPYFEEVEQFLGISGPTPYPWGPARPKGYALPPLPLNSAAQLMLRGAEKIGIKTSPAANAALSAPYFQEGVGWRQACTNRGFCQAGCSNGAKASMDVTYIPLAVKYGAEIRPDSFVTEIERNEKGLVSAVVYTQNGQTHRQACRHLFLCGGSVETPRLMMLNELGLTSGQVGRNLMAHTGVQVWGTFEEEVRPNKGIPGGLISQDTHRPKDADFVGGYVLQSIGVMPVTFSGQVARGRKLWGQPLRDYMRQYNHIAGINILGDCLPHTKNYIELSEELDGRLLPKPRIHFTAQENELRMNAHAETIMRRIWEAAGATDIWAFGRYAHVIGTARMGLSGDDAVVDRDGRAFDVPNLYISDNSTFPSALSVNPALTIMALSLRTADKFLERERRRDA